MQLLLDDNDLTARGVKPTSKVQRWRLIKAGKFPRPIKQGSRNTWLESEIDQYITTLIRERDEVVKVA